MEQFQELNLGVGPKVDEKIATGNQIEPGERRIFQDVLRGEDHHFASLLFDPVAILLLDEIAGETLGPNIPRYSLRVNAGAGGVDGVAVEIGGKNLHGETFIQARHDLLQEDGQ